MRVVISQFLIFCILVQTNFIAYGQVRTDGTTSTSVTQAANGVDVVNIANANSRGLSHNKYIDFNVANKGLILNNAKTVSRSQLGGVINGNQGLRNQARLILNEVTSSNRSKLNGYIEVHGQAADVIIANPNGISCNGCGFINTPSATLTTGKPIVNGGELQRFDVNGGKVTIGELGLDATRADYFDIISRSVEVNGDIHAKNKLQVITGRNNVDYKTKVATKKADDGSTKPEFSIDSSALGGMYAGAISLVGTEDGVGVKAPENAVASLGDFNISADGKVVLNNAVAKKSLKMNAKEVEVAKSVYGRDLVDISATDVNVAENALLASSKLIKLEADKLELNEGANILSNLNETGDLNSSGKVVATLKSLNINGDSRIYGQSELNLESLNISVDKKLTLDDSVVNFSTNQVLETGEIDAHTSLQMNSTADINNKIKIQGDNLAFKAKSFNNEAQLISFGNLAIDTDEVLLNSGKVEAADSILVKSRSNIKNDGGLILARNSIILQASDEIYNGRSSDIISSEGDIYLQGLNGAKANLVKNNAGNIESIQGDININAVTFKNLSQGYEKETFYEERDRRIEGHKPTTPTYWYQAYDTATGEIAYIIGTIPWTAENATYRGPSYTAGHLTWRDTGRRGARELWPHQEYKNRTIVDQRQKNAQNFVQGSILANGNINIDADSFENNLSLIAANNDVNISGGDFSNLSGVYNRTVTTRRWMENRRRGTCDLSRCWKSYRYWDDPVTTPSNRFAFSTIEAGGDINLSVTRNISNGSQDDDKTSTLSQSAQFTDELTQNTDINLTSISNRENLFREVPNVDSEYLFETDSQFINLDNFYSSDYFLDQVFNDTGNINQPEETIRRRYGDAYVEDRLVRDQLFSISGRRLLDGYTDSYDQMQALYDNALDNMNELDLSFGVKLTADQISRLTKDMVWLEKQTINGVEVLVPRVYLSEVTLENLGSKGAQIVASETNIFAGNLFNTDLIKGRKKLHIDTGNLFNLGGRISGGDVSIKAANIINKTLTESGSTDSSVYVDVTDFWTGEKKKVQTDINTSSYTVAGNQALIESTGNLDITTSGVVQNVGGNIDAGGNLNIQANGGVTSISVQETYKSDYKGHHEERKSSLTHLKGRISTGKELNISGDKITLVGTDLEAGDDINLTAENGVEIVSVQNESNYFFFQKNKGGMSSKKTTKRRNSTLTQMSEITAGSSINITSKTKDVLIQAAILKSDGEVNIEAVEGDIKLVSAIDTMFKQDKVESKNAVNFKNTDKGEESKTHQGVQIYAKDVNLEAKSIHIDVRDSIDQLSNEEGFEYLDKLKNDPRIDWNLVQDSFDEWDRTQTGLSEAATLLIAIAVSAAMPGLGTGVFAAMGKAALVSLTTQASTSLVANNGDLGAVFKELSSSEYLKGLALATVTAGTGGDIISDTLIRAGADSLIYGSSFGDSLESHAKSAAINMVANAVGGIGGDDVMGDFINAGANATILAGAESLIYQTSFSNSLEKRAKSEAISLGGKLAANEIAAFYKEAKDADGVSAGEYIAHKVAHAALGCAMGAASNGDCGSGATGSVSAEIAAEIMANSKRADLEEQFMEDGVITIEEARVGNVELNSHKSYVLDISSKIGQLATSVAGGDIEIARETGYNSVLNNQYDSNTMTMFTTTGNIPDLFMGTSEIKDKFENEVKVAGEVLKDGAIGLGAVALSPILVEGVVMGAPYAGAVYEATASFCAHQPLKCSGAISIGKGIIQGATNSGDVPDFSGSVFENFIHNSFEYMSENIAKGILIKDSNTNKLKVEPVLQRKKNPTLRLPGQNNYILPRIDFRYDNNEVIVP